MSLNHFFADLPEDPDALVARILDPEIPEELKNQARLVLGPLIRRLARIVAQGKTSQVAQDLIDESVSWILLPERLAKFQIGRSFLYWCRKVLENRYRDLWRRQKRRPDQKPEVTQLKLEISPSRCGWRPLNLELPFEEGDLNIMEGWKHKKHATLSLLCLTGWWVKVPALRWQEWCRQCSLSEPFPPNEFLAAPDEVERAAILAAALGIGRNTLSQYGTRYFKCFAELKCIQELEP